VRHIIWRVVSSGGSHPHHLEVLLPHSLTGRPLPLRVISPSHLVTHVFSVFAVSTFDVLQFPRSWLRLCVFAVSTFDVYAHNLIEIVRKTSNAETDPKLGADTIRMHPHLYSVFARLHPLLHAFNSCVIPSCLSVSIFPKRPTLSE
jgi:hypothetical protein